jgi:LacI family transcriptional regulator, galactose operon repressor
MNRVGRRPTMKEVAAVAGVSLSTVSRVVNGEEVRADLAERVQGAVEMLGYRRDHTASTLRRADRMSASIGLIIDDVGNPFFSVVHRGVEEVARERGVLVFVGSSDEDSEREHELADAFGARGVDGLILVPSGTDQSYLQRERRAGVGVVFVDRPPRLIDADAVLSDNAAGARLAVAHLVATGHRRIGFLGDRPEIFTAAERLRGYREAIAAAGLPYDDRIVMDEILSATGGYAATRELLSGPEPPTALFSSQNLITIGAVRALVELGRHGRTAIVGFDDVPMGDAVRPGLTVVAQDPGALGRTAAERLFARLDGDGSPAREVVLPVSLIERGSGEIAPA